MLYALNTQIVTPNESMLLIRYLVAALSSINLCYQTRLHHFISHIDEFFIEIFQYGHDDKLVTIPSNKSEFNEGSARNNQSGYLFSIASNSNVTIDKL